MIITILYRKINQGQEPTHVQSAFIIIHKTYLTLLTLTLQHYQ